MAKRLKGFSFLSSDEDEDDRPGTSKQLKRVIIETSSDTESELQSQEDGLSWHEPHIQFGPRPRDGRKFKKVNGRSRQKKIMTARKDASEEEQDPFEALRALTDEKFYSILNKPEDEFIEWLKSIKLLPTIRNCPLCNDPMSPKFDKRKNYPRWRCGRKVCKRKEVGFFVGSFFEKLQWTPKEAMKLVWKWTQKENNTQNLQLNFLRDDDSTVARQTIADWKSYLRQLCMLDVGTNKQPIGGDNVCVMIDETVITKRKYNRGAVRAEEQWFLGGVDTAGNCWIVPVAGRKKQDLIPPIVENVRPGSILVTDCLATYTSITKDHPEMLWRHFTCNHSDEAHPFVDQSTGACTNAIEGVWSHFKARHKNERGTHRSLLLSHTAEFLWRRKYNSDYFYHIVRSIREYYSNW